MSFFLKAVRKRSTGFPISGIADRIFLVTSLVLKYPGVVRMFDRLRAKLPMFFEIDISFSFMTMSSLRSPACGQLLSASCTMPPVKAPSPITATVQLPLPDSFSASAMPSAADSAVELCPAPNGSYTLSERLVKPEIPPGLRSVSKLSNLPVSSLWT